MEVSTAQGCSSSGQHPLAVACALLGVCPVPALGSPAGVWHTLAVGAVGAHAVCAAGHCCAARARVLGVSVPAVTRGDIRAVGSPGDCPGLVLD